MDRHQYVKELIGQRDNLKKDVESLRSKIEKARKRTKEAVLDFGEATCYNLCGDSCSINFHSGVMYISSPEEESVSDTAIKKLHKSIFELENAKSALEIELIDLQSRDFVKHLKDLINKS